ncbi:MAG: YdaU family protein [Planctomycetes bacterium]|nr:YdaU family protein [Planctomycetota bacterium]
MNYYERHLGDYAKDAGHLSLVEHGAYTLLLDRYYATEKPIPKTDAYRVCRASARQERAAVDRVLAEFFVESPDGWVNKRCEEEIARFSDKREKAKRSADARWKASERNANASADAMRTHSVGNALQSPVTRLQSPDVLQPSSQVSLAPSSPAHASARASDGPREVILSPAGQACRQMREAGCLDVNPSHPNLLAALAEGVTPDQLRDLALELPGKRFAYLIATARSRRVDVPLVSAAGGGAAAPVLQTWTPPDDETPEERPRA